MQVLRTFPYRRPGYDFAPAGERSIARAYRKALPTARSLVYIEDQYLWGAEVVAPLAQGLAANPGLHVIIVIPRFPDQDGRLSAPPNLTGRAAALAALRAAGGARVAVYGLENAESTPVYVHAKVCLADDTWAVIGSDNFNRRSWTHDSELSCAVLDESPGLSSFAGQVRQLLAAEHLGLPTGEQAPALPEMFGAFRAAAARLDAWHDAGRTGRRRPAAQLPGRAPVPLDQGLDAATVPGHLRPGRTAAAHACR